MADVGRARVVEHFEGMRNPATAAWRRRAETQLEGVDVFWAGHDGLIADATSPPSAAQQALQQQPTRHRKQRARAIASKGAYAAGRRTHFGKMYVVPYPWRCVFVDDDSDEYAILWGEDVALLCQQNASPEVQWRRSVRRRLRACDGLELRFPWSQTEDHKVQDGTRRYKDPQSGKMIEEPRFTEMKVFMNYTMGRLTVETNNDLLPYAAGFKVSLYYADGRGTAIAPHTGKHVEVTNSATLTMERMGIRHDYRRTPELCTLLDNNASLMADALRELDEADAAYRARLRAARAAAETTLRSAFWLRVYDDDGASRHDIEAYFSAWETRSAVASLPTTHAAGLDYLFGRMRHVQRHPCAALWYIFIDDVWECNRDLSVLRPHADALDPRSSRSIAYTPMRRRDLEEFLDARGLLRPPLAAQRRGGGKGPACGARCIARQLFHPRLLDVLYARMEALDALVQLQAAKGGTAAVPAGGGGGRGADVIETHDSECAHCSCTCCLPRARRRRRLR